MKSISWHNSEVSEISEQIKRSSSTKKIRFYHGGTNSTRQQNSEEYIWMDISKLGDVIEINDQENTATIEPNIPMDKLVLETLKHGLIPQVVMEFPGITAGGGINGGSLESSSFKYGQFSDTTLEYELVLGNGEITTANPKINKDLFYGISGSYGTIALLTLIKIKLIPAGKYVEVDFNPYNSWQEVLRKLKDNSKNNKFDFLEGIIFDENRGVMIWGKMTDLKNQEISTYSKANDPWFYQTAKKSVIENKEISQIIPIKDYLFRYNRGAFWMGEYALSFFHIPNNKFMKTILNPIMNTRKLYDGLHAVNLSQEYLIQDFYVPLNKILDFLKFNDIETGIYPVWLCPMKPTKNPQKLSPHFINADMLMDVGIYGKSEKFSKDTIGINKSYEIFARNNDSRKMLYAHTYYDQKYFWKIYDEKWYLEIRKKYRSDLVFPNIFNKVKVSEKYHVHKMSGALKIIFQTITGRNLNS